MKKKHNMWRNKNINNKQKSLKLMLERGRILMQMITQYETTDHVPHNEYGKVICAILDFFSPYRYIISKSKKQVIDMTVKIIEKLFEINYQNVSCKKYLFKNLIREEIFNDTLMLLLSNNNQILLKHIFQVICNDYESEDLLQKECYRRTMFNTCFSKIRHCFKDLLVDKTYNKIVEKIHSTLGSVLNVADQLLLLSDPEINNMIFSNDNYYNTTNYLNMVTSILQLHDIFTDEFLMKLITYVFIDRDTKLNCESIFKSNICDDIKTIYERAHKSFSNKCIERIKLICKLNCHHIRIDVMELLLYDNKYSQLNVLVTQGNFAKYAWDIVNNADNSLNIKIKFANFLVRYMRFNNINHISSITDNVITKYVTMLVTPTEETLNSDETFKKIKLFHKEQELDMKNNTYLWNIIKKQEKLRTSVYDYCTDKSRHIISYTNDFTLVNNGYRLYCIDDDNYVKWSVSECYGVNKNSICDNYLYYSDKYDNLLYVINISDGKKETLHNFNMFPGIGNERVHTIHIVNNKFYLLCEKRVCMYEQVNNEFILRSECNHYIIDETKSYKFIGNHLIIEHEYTKLCVLSLLDNQMKCYDKFSHTSNMCIIYQTDSVLIISENGAKEIKVITKEENIDYNTKEIIFVKINDDGFQFYDRFVFSETIRSIHSCNNVLLIQTCDWLENYVAVIDKNVSDDIYVMQYYEEISNIIGNQIDLDAFDATCQVKINKVNISSNILKIN
jgi:hypothetical protein